MNKDISKTITALRFPICVMVVFIHSTLSVNMGGVDALAGGGYYVIHDYVSYGLCASAVPLFFLISGYLYFKGSESHFGWHEYVGKNKKRVRTLFVPYILWNIFTLFLFWCVQTIMPNMTSGKHFLIADYTINDWVMAFWNAGEGFPINGPMWFIRDFIVLSLLSIVIYPFIKNKLIGLFILILFFAFGIRGEYFILGAWLGVHGIDFVNHCKKIWIIAIIGYFVLVGINMSLDDTFHDIIKSIHVFLGVVAITGLVGSIYEKREIGRNMLFLSGTSFFIYAFHQQPLLMMCKLWKKFMPSSDIFDITGYFLLPFVIIAISVLLYISMQRIAPKTLAVLTGGRG